MDAAAGAAEGGVSMIVVNGWAFIAFLMAVVALVVNLSMRGK